MMNTATTTTGAGGTNNISPPLRRRANRGGGGTGGSHRLSGVTSLTRPPILLSFTSLSLPNDNDLKTNIIIEAGHVGHPRWKHSIELSSLSSLSIAATTKQQLVITIKDETLEDNNVNNDNVMIDVTSSDSYYRIYANTMEHVFHLLGQDSKDRRVIIIHPGLYVQRYWKIAMTRILQEIIGTPAVSFQSSISMIPFAFPPTSNNNTLLLIHITLQEAQCMIFADKLVLEYTYQACGYPESVRKDRDGIKSTPSLLDVTKMQDAWINDETDETNSLICLILKTLEACPRQLRLYAIHSMVFSGNIVDPYFSLMIAKKLEATLKSDDSNTSTTTSADESKPMDANNQEEIRENNKSRWSYVPFNQKLLMPLADHISVVQFTPQHIRPDLLPWIGASAWANHWHEQDPDSPQLHWQSLTPIPLLHTEPTTSEQ